MIITKKVTSTNIMSLIQHVLLFVIKSSNGRKLDTTCITVCD